MAAFIPVKEQLQMAGEPVQRRLQFVLEHFGKRPIENVVLNYFSLANEVYTITTREGQFVVKNCFKNNSRELVANEAGLIQFLNDHQVPCPKLIPTLKGDLFLEYDGQFYIMNEFVEGWVPKWHDTLSEQLMHETMHAMADFHRATEHFKPPFEPNRTAALAIPDARLWLQALQPTLAQDSSPRQSVPQMLSIVDELLELADSLQARLATRDLSVLKKVFIHGDLHCFNLIFSADQKIIGRSSISILSAKTIGWWIFSGPPDRWFGDIGLRCCTAFRRVQMSTGSPMNSCKRQPAGRWPL